MAEMNDIETLDKFFELNKALRDGQESHNYSAWMRLRAALSAPSQGPAAWLDALGQEIISAACLAYGVRGNGDKAPMIALDDAVRAYMAAPALVPAAPEASVDAIRDEGPGGLHEYFAMLHRLVNRHGSSISGERFECRDALGKIENEIVSLRRALAAPVDARKAHAHGYTYGIADALVLVLGDGDPIAAEEGRWKEYHGEFAYLNKLETKV